MRGNKLRIKIQNHEEHTVLFPTPVGPITLKLVSTGNKVKKSMDRVARNHDVSRPTANHNILDCGILFRQGCFNHIGVVVEWEEFWLL